MQELPLAASAFGMPSFLSMIMGVMGALSALAVIMPLAYFFIRWRAYKEGGAVDQQLGVKLILNFFRIAGLGAMAAGVIGMANALAEGRGVDMEGLSGNFVLLVTGAVAAIGSLLVLARSTNQAAFPQARRFFDGALGLAMGIFALASFYQFFQPLMAHGNFALDALIDLVVSGALAVWLLASILPGKEPISPAA